MMNTQYLGYDLLSIPEEQCNIPDKCSPGSHTVPNFSKWLQRFDTVYEQ